jgi:hypothetical protein
VVIPVSDKEADDAGDPKHHTKETEMNVKMRSRGRRGAQLLAAAAVTLGGLLASVELAVAAPAPPPVPTEIKVPAGNVLTSMGQARGFQVYVCQATATGYAWTLQQPLAVLLQDGYKPFALHYGGPTWLAMDGSSVVAARAGSAPAPSAGAIPWLLLKATSNAGPAGGTFTSTTYIQRLNTAGGLAPATGCDAAHLGATAPVYYTADYYFYRAA